MPWRIKTEDAEWSEEQVTVDEAVDICQLAGGGWEMLQPTTGPAAAAAIVTRFRIRQGEEQSEAIRAVGALPVAELMVYFTEV